MANKRETTIFSQGKAKIAGVIIFALRSTRVSVHRSGACRATDDKNLGRKREIPVHTIPEYLFYLGVSLRDEGRVLTLTLAEGSTSLFRITTPF